MQTRVQKWGNSLGLRVPAALAGQLHLHAGSDVLVFVSEGRLVVEPLVADFHDLSALIADITPDNMHAESDWGPQFARDVG